MWFSLPQGVFIKRHKATKENGVGFFTPEDFAVAETVTVYGRTFHLVDCDGYTREWYSARGKEMAGPGGYPDDPIDQYRSTFGANKGRSTGTGELESDAATSLGICCIHVCMHVSKACTLPTPACIREHMANACRHNAAVGSLHQRLGMPVCKITKLDLPAHSDGCNACSSSTCIACKATVYAGLHLHLMSGSSKRAPHTHDPHAACPPLTIHHADPALLCPSLRLSCLQ